MPRLALSGGAYQARSVIAAAQRSLNLFAEPLPQSAGEPSLFAHYPTPGITRLGTLPENCVRGIRQCTTGGIYAVAGSGVYLVDPSNWTGTLLGQVTPGRTTPVSMTDNGKTLVIVDGVGGWTIDLATRAFNVMGQAVTLTPDAAASSEAILAGTARYTPFTPAQDGLSLATVTLTLATGYTGNMRCSLFAATANGNMPSNALATATDLVNPVGGANTFDFSNDLVALSQGTLYWIGFDSDTTAGAWSVAAGGSGVSSSTDYASFPATSPSVSGANAIICSMTLGDDPGGMFVGADVVGYLDTFFIFNKPATPQFYWSLSQSAAFDTYAQDFANKASYSDLLITLAVAQREIWLLGERTTEIWIDVGAQDTQFQQQPGVFIDHGCAAKYSVATYDNSVYWLSYDRGGQGIVLRGGGYQAQRVSTYALEAHLAEAMPRIDDAIGFVYQLGGHAFYVLTFPEADETWVYDITTGQWHEWRWLDSNGREHRHRANCCAFINGMVIVGDWENGHLYHVDSTVLTDDGQPIKRQRAYPHLLNEGHRVFYRQLIADLETGNPPQAQSQTLSYLETCTFTAPDNTRLEDYSVPGEATWTLMPGGAGAKIEGDQLVINAGTADTFYRSPLQATDDYSTFFRVIPSSYARATISSMWALARNNGADEVSGYKAQISGDGTQYYLYLQIGFSGAAQGVALGTLASGWFLVELVTIGANIAVACQRSQDGLWVQPDGSWSTAYAAALVKTDSTYSGAGYVLIGGIVV